MEKTESILNPCTGVATAPASQGANSHLMGGRLLARNVIWNLIGNGAPMLAAVFCIPSVVRLVGFGGPPVALPDQEMEAMRSAAVEMDAADLRSLS